LVRTSEEVSGEEERKVDAGDCYGEKDACECG